MPSRDYAVRSKKAKNSVNKLLILALVTLLILMSGLVLWMLKSNAPVQSSPSNAVQAQQAQLPKSELPSRPEEIYSYIRDLETREVPVDKNSKLAQLTKEQELQIQKQKEEEQKKLAQEQAATQKPDEVKTTEQTTKTQAEPSTAPQEKPVQETASNKEKAPVTKEEKKEPAKTVAAKPATETAKTIGKFGLQCGAFKNKAQAENMQARLAMAGYNARIVSSGEWNRVFVGPVGDRAAASSAQSNARSVAECLVVGMN